MSIESIDYSVEYLGANKPVNLTQPLLSVRIITYNHENYISDCIESVLMQETSFPFEIVIGEDDSTDRTREIVKQYAVKYQERIRLILRGKQNKIIIDGIKTGRFNFVETIKSCRGQFIAMLDGDDRWIDPSKLQKQVDFLLTHPSYVVAVHEAKLVDTRGKILRESLLKNEMKRDISELELKKGFGIILSTMCFRNVIDHFPEEFYKIMNGDVFLTSLLGNHGKGKYMAEIVPGWYRIHPGSMYTSLSASRALDFYISTCIQLSNYYRRTNDTELENYFGQKQHTLSRIRRSRIKLGLFALKKHVYRSPLHFLADKVWLFFNHFLKAFKLSK